MKKWFVLAGVLAIVLIGAYLILTSYALRFIEPHLRKALGPGLTAGEIQIKSTYVSAKKLKYEDPTSNEKFFEIEEVRVYPALYSFIKGELRIKELSILQPNFYFSRSREGMFRGPLPPIQEKRNEEDRPEEPKGTRQSVPVQIDRIRIEGGFLDFEDRKFGDPPARIQLRDLALQIDDVHYPITSTPCPFELKGKMTQGVKGGEIEAKGWIDPQALDMEASFKMQEIGVKTFEPYYRKRVSAEIDSGSINLDTKIKLKQRTIDAPGSLELVDLRMKEEGTVFWVPAKILLSLLKGKGDRIRANFHVRGNIDDPKFDLQENILNRIGFSLGEALGFPMKSVGEAVMGGAGKGAEGLAEGLKSIGEIFKKGEKK